MYEAAVAVVAVLAAAVASVAVARMPVYFVAAGGRILREWPLLLIAVAGVVERTRAGEGVLGRIPERVFRTLVALLILALGVHMRTRGF